MKMKTVQNRQQRSPFILKNSKAMFFDEQDILQREQVFDIVKPNEF